MNIKEYLTTINYDKGNNKINKYIVIHYVGAVSTAKNNATYFHSVDRQASANYFVDDNEIYRVVKDNDIAWHCGSNKYYCDARNSNSIGIEMCCYMNNGKLDVSDATVTRTIELTKELMAKYNIPVKNVVRHYDVTRKNCPAPFVSEPTRWDNFKNKLLVKKSIEEIAREVIQGKWGNGVDRKNRLEAAGYNYNTIQNKVNELCKPKPTLKSVDTIAKEVIQGKWGNGTDRRNRLTKAGYNYKEVQTRVNQLL